ncbi:hypothetical protein, partial [Segatella sp.]|uniref:hypothetical protein n=1 Tax=Segatella sp. TaxID=2974253 RepID=UPI003AB29276
MYIVVFYSYLLKLTEWLMLAISGIESTTCFKNFRRSYVFRYGSLHGHVLETRSKLNSRND